VVSKPQTPAISAARLSGGRFNFSVSGNAGPDYSILGATNLAATNWMTLLTTNPVTLPFSWGDTNTARLQYYYRILLGP